MIEVFKTNVSDAEQSQRILEELSSHFLESRLTFDLDDCDKILRIEAQSICPLFICDYFHKKGLCAELLM